MNGVDLASQFRNGFSIHHPGSIKWWKPLFFWLIDVCTTNAFLIWRSDKSTKDKGLHKQFYDLLIDEALSYDPWTPAPATPSKHRVVHLDKKIYCVNGSANPGACIQGMRMKGREEERQFGTVISGNIRKRRRSAQVRTACYACNAALCTKGTCWEQFHTKTKT